MSMNIYSPCGTKVKALFDESGSLMNGYDYEKETASLYLNQNEIYTVDKTEVHSWSTKVYLQEYPNIPFNSVHFEEYIDTDLKFRLSDLILVWAKAQEVTIENTSFDSYEEVIDPDYSYIEKERNAFFKKQFEIDISK